MDMKKILQAMDGASTKPVEGSNDMAKFMTIVTEGASPHKVTLPVQMAMQHYAEPVVEKPKTIKEVKKSAMSGLLHQYYTEAQEEVEADAVAKKELISEQARMLAQRVLAKESRVDELSKKTLQSYKEKAEDQVEELKPHAKDGEYKDLAKNTIKRREAGIDNATKKIAAKESFDPEYDDEAGMAHGSLHTLKRAVDGLMNTIDDRDNLPEWCQEKISLAEDYLVTVWDYLQSEEAQGMAESRDKWDSNMPGHERYAGMGRGGREDDEYHVPDPVDNRIAYKVIATVTTPDGNEDKKGVSVKTVSGPKHAETVAIKHLEGAGFQVKSINSVQDLGPV